MATVAMFRDFAPPPVPSEAEGSGGGSYSKPTKPNLMSKPATHRLHLRGLAERLRRRQTSQDP